MQQLVNEGKIKARTKWKTVYPLFSTDDRYLGMFGNPGSNPLELFWDCVEGLDQKFDAKLSVVNDVIHRHNAKLQLEGGDEDEDMKGDSDGLKPFAVGPETTEEQFLGVVKNVGDDALTNMSSDDLHEVFLSVRVLFHFADCATKFTGVLPVV